MKLTARASALQLDAANSAKYENQKKLALLESQKENRKKPLPRARQDLKKAKVKMEPWEWREEETKKVTIDGQTQTARIEVLLAYVSDHWHYEDPIYRFIIIRSRFSARKQLH